jgi:hypothetical protein
VDGGLILPPGLRVAGGGARELDPLDGINSGLIGFWPLDEAGGAVARDLSPRGVGGAISGATRGVVGRQGRVTTIGGSTQGVGLASNSALQELHLPITICGWVYLTSTASGRTILGQYKDWSVPGGIGKLLRVDGTELRYYTTTNSGNYQQTSGGPAISLNIWTFVAVTVIGPISAPVWRLRRDLTEVTGSLAALRTDGPLVEPSYIGNSGFNIATSGAENWAGSLSAVRAFGRALTSSELTRLYRDPWAGTTDPAERLFHVVRLGGAPTLNNYTLTLDPGAFTLSGQAVGLRASRRLPLAAGAFTLSGQALALRISRRLALAAGTFTLSGQSLALRASRRVALAAGAFTLAGQPVALLAGRRLVLAPGSFALVGQPVTLSYSENLVHRTLVAEPGSFAVVGQDVRLLAGRRIALAAGAFSLSGQPVTLRAARRMQLGAGAVALTGQLVALLAGRRMTIDAATLALTGQPVALRAARRLALSAGPFVLTGQPVDLAYSGQLRLLAGPTRILRPRMNPILRARRPGSTLRGPADPK